MSADQIKPCNQNKAMFESTETDLDGLHDQRILSVNQGLWADPFDIFESQKAAIAKRIEQDKCSVKQPDVLDRLAKEYIQVLVDPASLPIQSLCEYIEPVKTEGTKIPEQSLAKNGPDTQLEDAVSGPLNIAQVLAQFGTEECRLDQAESDGHADILKLFAGEILLVKQSAQLPLLTRREHHAMSVDSHYVSGHISSPLLPELTQVLSTADQTKEPG